ncbi:hypothetical protein [Rhizohabitans arisaemae]|uniref:hypothetical protein n=1 Tax=Rhizohabitans arisaemae TaxID=2720610 RepID=UPI0024B28188|nr:hypothetical protein [Rhizohabitans arisaemae]
MSSPDLRPTAEEVQRRFAEAFKLYAAHLRDGGYIDPFAPDDDITATDVVTVAGALLHAQNLEVFELALWQSWGGVPWKAVA